MSNPYLSFPIDTTNLLAFGGRGNIGDLNGDRYIDWTAGGRFRSAEDEIQYRIHWGGPFADSTPDFSFMLPRYMLLTPIGDFNGDSFDDLLFYDHQSDSSSVLFGSAEFDTIPDSSRGGMWSSTCPARRERKLAHDLKDLINTFNS